MTDFLWVPSFSSAASIKVRLKKTKFGDGYEQRGTDGINMVTRDWDLTFNKRTDTEANDIEAFLEANAGTALSWTPPGGIAALKYTCDSWKRSYLGFDSNDLVLPFTQVFE